MRRHKIKTGRIALTTAFALAVGGYAALESAYDIHFRSGFGMIAMDLRPDGKRHPATPGDDTLTALLTQAATRLEQRLHRAQEYGRIGTADIQTIAAAARAYAAAPPAAARTALLRAIEDNTTYNETQQDFVIDMDRAQGEAHNIFYDSFSPTLTRWLREEITRSHGCAMRSTRESGLFGGYASYSVAFPEKISCNGDKVATMALPPDPTGMIKNIDFAEGRIFYAINENRKDGIPPGLAFEPLSALDPARLAKLFERKAEIEAMLAQEIPLYKQSFEKNARARVMNEIGVALPQGPAP